jgi:hypothetical protein
MAGVRTATTRSVVNLSAQTAGINNMTAVSKKKTFKCHVASSHKQGK